MFIARRYRSFQIQFEKKSTNFLIKAINVRSKYVNESNFYQTLNYPTKA
jgi:hypothetical protein